MNMTAAVSSERITRELHTFEAMLAQTLAAGAQLNATMTAARAEFDAVPALGHKAMLLAARVQNALLSANGDTARVHQSLRQVALELGIMPEETGRQTGILAQRAPLSLVA